MACNFFEGPWPLVRQLRCLRVVQLTFTALLIASSSYLIAFLKSHDGNLSGATTVPLIMEPLTFIITAFQQWIGTRLCGDSKRGYLLFFLFLDLLCISLQVPLIVVTSVAGLPDNCDGVAHGLDSSVFGGSDHGLLKQHCAVPSISFWMPVVLMVLYVYTVSLIIRQIIQVGGAAELPREEQKASESNERNSANIAAGQAPPRHFHISRYNQTETVDLRDEPVRDAHSRDRNAHISPPPAVLVPDEEPPPYIPDEVPDLAKSLKKD